MEACQTGRPEIHWFYIVVEWDAQSRIFPLVGVQRCGHPLSEPAFPGRSLSHLLHRVDSPLIDGFVEQGFYRWPTHANHGDYELQRWYLCVRFCTI